MTTRVRNPGRPRDRTVDKRVIEAALDILNDDGLAGLTVEAISSKAGTSKASFYRRWDSREEMLVDVIASLAEGVEIPDTGDLRSDLTTAVRRIRRFASDTRAGEILPWLVGEIASKSPIGLRYATAVIAPRRQMVAQLLTHAVERGDLRQDLDVDTAVDMLVGPIIMRSLIGTLQAAPETWPESLADSLISGWV